MYAGTDGLNLGNIYDGLPIDGVTLYWSYDSEGNKILKSAGSVDGEGGVSDFWALHDIPSWITVSKPYYTTSEISEGNNLYFTNARAVSALAETLKYYVTLGDTQTITGEKNFTGGLKVNGSPIIYDSSKKYWKLEGDLLVTGGVTMFGNDSDFNPSTITDAVKIDNVTIKRNSQGALYAVGGGTADSVVWDNITGKPTFAAVATSGKYDDLIGKPTLLSSFTNDLGLGSNAYTSTDYLPSASYTASDILSKLKTVDGSGSGLDADLLEGKHLSDILASNVASADALKKTWIEDPNYAKGSNAVKIIVNTSDTPGNYADAYSSGLSVMSSYVGWQLMSYGGSDENPYFRSLQDTGRWKPWKKLAFLTDNVASATKLQTARTVWGQSFDGTGDISGNLTLDNNKAIVTTDTSGNTLQVFKTTNNNHLAIGYGSAVKSYKTILYGNEIQLQYGTDDGVGLYVNSSGNVGIGTTRPACKLDVNGETSITGALTKYNSDKTYRFVFAHNNNEARIYNIIEDGSVFGNIRIGTTNSSCLFFDGVNYRLGIGTTSPDYTLHVVGTTHINGEASFNNSVTLKGTGSSTARIIMSRSSYNYINYPTDGKLCLGTSNSTSSTQLCIDGSNGYVGVGTTSPEHRLHVNGVIKTNNDIYVQGNNDTKRYVQVSNSVASISLYVATSGNKGLYDFDINKWLIYSDNTNTIFTIGNVGVGISSPPARLSVDGDILATGGITMYSMRSLKNIQDERGLSLEELSIIKPTRYTWKDGRDNKIHIGGIADDVMKVLPEVVYKTSDGTLTMDYGNAAFAIASSLINPVINHEERIALLEEENKQLRQELERLKSE